jgi:chorismate--pyruvate lyase
MTLIDPTTHAAAAAPADPHLWLPGHALNCYEGDVELRSWLLTPGLLTERVREATAGAFRMNVLSERSEAGDHIREIELCCAGRAWIYAQTRVPATTLAAQPWLGCIGRTPLGEALAAHGAVRRSEFEYARLYDDVDIVRDALARRGLPSQALWVRRSTFAIGPHALTLREVFLPDIGRLAT